MKRINVKKDSVQRQDTSPEHKLPRRTYFGGRRRGTTTSSTGSNSDDGSRYHRHRTSTRSFDQSGTSDDDVVFASASPKKGSRFTRRISALIFSTNPSNSKAQRKMRKFSSMYYSSDEDDGGNEDEAMHDVRDINSLRLKKSPVGTSNSPGIQHAVSMVDTDWKDAATCKSGGTVLGLDKIDLWQPRSRDMSNADIQKVFKTNSRILLEASFYPR